MKITWTRFLGFTACAIVGGYCIEDALYSNTLFPPGWEWLWWVAMVGWFGTGIGFFIERDI